MQVVGRQYNLGGGKYRYGFNGKENDNEVKGDGNQQDYGMRVYDPRVGRFLSVDPLMSEYAWNSTYAYAENKPVNYEDIDGLQTSVLRPMARPSSTRPVLSNYFVEENGNITRSRPARLGNPPSIMPNEGLSRTVGGYYVSTPNGGFYVPDSKNKAIPGRYRTDQERQFDNLAMEAQTMRYYFERDLNSEKSIKTNSQAPNLPLSQSRGDESNQGKVIGLGVNMDLINHRRTGAIIYKQAGWQIAGLTKVDWGRASMDNSHFMESFREAAKNATGIRFDVTNFKLNAKENPTTYAEFQHVTSTPSLLNKTTFIQEGKEVKWNGTKFE